ncbi:hypothetical protein [Pseudomonas sp. CFII64]|uniref:hypothetical protein n=1 Tax=Pseudomonas sp. CFII64 TaxID=911242 RepID=UPI0004058BB3|nr:hypothetical protein [Pseudomonas sp. CFII64]
MEPVKRAEFSYQRSDLRHPDSEVRHLKGDHIVWWYGPLRKNPRAMSIPLVKVAFRRLYNDIPGPHTTVTVPLSSLPHYRLGTIWQEGRGVSDTKQLTKKFHVDFSPNGWSITSRADLHSQGMSHIFPVEEYALKWGNRDQSKLINFNQPDGKNILVPCTEFFVRAYARNMDVCRALATLRWSDVMAMLYDDPTRSEQRYLVRPTSRMRKYDAVFLAHLLYDDYTAMRVKNINAQFVSRSPDERFFLEATPWFSGLAQILCRGRWINNGDTFLCLDLKGASQPKGAGIEWQGLSFDSSNGVDGAGRLILPRPVKTALEEEFLAEVSYAEPDSHAGITVVKAPPFVTLGEERTVTKTKRIIEADRSRVGPQPPSAESHSSGEGRGAGKNTGKLEHEAEAELESRGFLRDIWNAFKSIQKENPKRVSDVNWYTPQHRFQKRDDLRIILLAPIEDPETENQIRNWVYLNGDLKKQRGVLVLRIKIDGKNYVCFEIQRDEVQEQKVVPRYAGVLVEVDSTPEEFEALVETVCSRVRYAMGRFKNMRSAFPAKAKIFKHTQTDETVLYRKRLVNVFNELEVILV